jgi:hypothetical protein
VLRNIQLNIKEGCFAALPVIHFPLPCVPECKFFEFPQVRQQQPSSLFYALEETLFCLLARMILAHPRLRMQA